MIYVVDSSVVLAAMLGEPGGEAMTRVTRGSEISVVNVSEVFAILASGGMEEAAIDRDFRRFELRLRTFRDAHAIWVGMLYPQVSDFGQSIGDRACLAQARSSGHPILTGDRRQAAAAERLGLDVELIR